LENLLKSNNNNNNNNQREGTQETTNQLHSPPQEKKNKKESQEEIRKGILEKIKKTHEEAKVPFWYDNQTLMWWIERIRSGTYSDYLVPPTLPKAISPLRSHSVSPPKTRRKASPSKPAVPSKAAESPKEGETVRNWMFIESNWERVEKKELEVEVGTKVEVLKTLGEWNYCRTEGNKTGWVPSVVLRPPSPPRRSVINLVP
jgi:hypothetical protein